MFAAVAVAIVIIDAVAAIVFAVVIIVDAVVFVVVAVLAVAADVVAVVAVVILLLLDYIFSHCIFFLSRAQEKSCLLLVPVVFLLLH